jgi:DNA-damage-inducible protein J
MVSNALVQTRIDSTIKSEAAIALAAMGLTVSDAVRLMLTRVAHDHALTFDVLSPNTETVAVIRESRQGNLGYLTLSDAINAIRSVPNWFIFIGKLAVMVFNARFRSFVGKLPLTFNAANFELLMLSLTEW